MSCSCRCCRASQQDSLTCTTKESYMATYGLRKFSFHRMGQSKSRLMCVFVARVHLCINTQEKQFLRTRAHTNKHGEIEKQWQGHGAAGRGGGGSGGGMRMLVCDGTNLHPHPHRTSVCLGERLASLCQATLRRHNGMRPCQAALP